MSFHFFAYSSDPVFCNWRIQIMLTITKDASAAISLPPLGVQSRDGVCNGEKEVYRLKSGEPNKRMMWAEQVFAIRDHQDKAAFAQVFAHFAPRVKSFLMRSGASPDIAEECAQDVMATLWRKSAQFDPAKASVSTWIFTIARNRRIDMLRKERRPEPEDLPWGPAAEPDQEEALALSQDTTRLGAALAELPEKQRTLIEKAYFGDLSHSEIADQTGLPLGTIKSRIRLALERLRHAMK